MTSKYALGTLLTVVLIASLLFLTGQGYSSFFGYAALAALESMGENPDSFNKAT